MAESHPLDLQVDLLAEREMTAVLQSLQDLLKKTDLRRLTDRMEELAANGPAKPS